MIEKQQMKNQMNNEILPKNFKNPMLMSLEMSIVNAANDGEVTILQNLIANYQILEQESKKCKTFDEMLELNNRITKKMIQEDLRNQ